LLPPCLGQESQFAMVDIDSPFDGLLKIRPNRVCVATQVCGQADLRGIALAKL
jgi:hypothetical protein